MRIAAFLLALAPALPAQILTITPPVITDCRNGLGRATLSWNSPLNTPVQVRVGARNGTPMTGFDPPVFSESTGDWVRDGMVFYLVNGDDYVIDSVTARVNCAGTPDTTTSAFTASQSYFPLQLGNRWVYRLNTRAQTNGWVSWTVSRMEQISDQSWFVLEKRTTGFPDAVEALYRADPDGRVYRIPNYPGDLHEELWLDPSGALQPPAVLVVQQRDVPLNTPLGPLPGLQYQSYGALSLETGAFIRGLGLLNSTANILAGSSGGFDFSLDLVEARIGQAIYYLTPAASVSVAAENSTLDVTEKAVTNCAIPCYFAACGLGGVVDPPGTWKPCFQARVRAGFSSCDQPIPLQAAIQLAASGLVVYQGATGLTAAPRQCDAVAYIQIPLYSAPNQPFPAGEYLLSVTVRSDMGEAGTASVPLTIK